MLQELAGLFRAIITIFYYIFAISYDLGWLLMALVKCVCGFALSVCNGIGLLLVAIFTDFKFFMGDVGDIMYNIGTTAIDGINATVSGISGVSEFILENFANLITTGHLKFCICGENIQNGLYGLLSIVTKIFLLIGQGAFFLITLIPNCCIYIGQKLWLSTGIAHNYLCSLVRSAVDQTAETFVLAAKRSREVPMEAAFGAVCIILAIRYRVWLRRCTWYVSYRVAQIVWRYFVLFARDRLLAWVAQISNWRSIPARWTMSVQQHGIATDLRQESLRPATSSKGRCNAPEVDNNCIICRDESKCVVLLPCRHLCLCIQCSNSWTRQRSTCPMCRMDVQQRIMVFT